MTLKHKHLVTFSAIMGDWAGSFRKTRASCRRALIAVALTGVTAAQAADTPILVQGDYTCPPGLNLLSINAAKDQRAEICNLIPEFDTARLAGQGVMTGPGLNCEITKAFLIPPTLSLCIEPRDFGQIRAVLLAGGFRSQLALTDMSHQNWRDALIIELANRTAGQVREYQTLSNDALADAGNLLIHFMRSQTIRPGELAQMDLPDMQHKLIEHLVAQTGQSVEELESWPLRALLRMVDQG